MSDVFQTDEYVVKDNPYIDQGSGGGGADLDSLATSTNAIADADLVVSKEGNTWYKKAASKIWDYIKSKIQASSNEVAYGTCTTAAGTATKVVTLDTAGNWTLKKGCRVCVKFTNTNTFSATAESPCKLNVNNTGAKNIYWGSSGNPTGTNTTAFGRANYINEYVYDGTYWVWCGSSADNNTTYSNMTTSELLTGTATSQRTMRADYTKAGIEALSTGYGTCDTAADVAAKVVTMNDSNWTLRVGAIIGVKFANTNSASNCTLNVNNTGAKSIWYNTEVYTAAGTWQCGTANRYIYYMYDGTYWVWMGQSVDAYTNNATRQYPTSTDADYRVLFSNGANDNDETNLTRKDPDFKYNPSTNTLTVGKIANTAVSDFTSGDSTDANATAWTSVTKVDNNTAFGTFFNRVSTMMKNVRYLYKLLGTTDISAIGGGTVTGALSALNTSLANKQDKLTNPLVQADVINNLTSTATNKPLSAYQGKVLNDGKVGGFYVKVFTVAHTFSNGVTSNNVTTNIAQSGWTPLGVIGVQDVSYIHVFPIKYYVSGNNLYTCLRRANNDAFTGSNVQYGFYILYYKFK